MKKEFHLNRALLIGVGVSLISVAVLILGLSFWEAFGGPSKFKLLRLPGFYELNLETPGLYVGVYEHRGSEPIPVKQLSQLSVQLMEKDTNLIVPVLMATSNPQIFDRFGTKQMLLFNFAIDHPGLYSLASFYNDDAKAPTVPVILFAQAAQNIKQTLIVGICFFLFFTALGVFLLLKINHWAPEIPKK